MAFMNQERKKFLQPRIKAILKKYGLKGSLSVHNHSALVLTIKSGKIDFIGNYNKNHTERPANGYIQVNEYWLADNYTGIDLKCLQALKEAMNFGNHNNSDIQTDYFDVGWYVNIYIGRWNKPYECTA